MGIFDQQQSLQQYSQQLGSLSQYTGLSSGGSGLGLGGGTFSWPQQPTITITPVPIPYDNFDPKGAVQIVYRFGKNLVSACLIKGTNNIETAKNVFLGQFTDTTEPEIVAAVAVEAV